jgi:uncharacterized membrane protein YobD (UPF0266 family)
LGYVKIKIGNLEKEGCLMEQLKQPIDIIEVKGIKDQELNNILIWTRGL